MIFWLNRIVCWIRMTFQTVRNVRNHWAPELKQLSDNIEKLEESLTGTDDWVYSLEETHRNRMDVLEELDAVKTENIEMRSHFNAMIKQLNSITALVNEKHGHDMIEQTFEIDPPPNKGYNLRSYVVDEDSFDT